MLAWKGITLPVAAWRCSPLPPLLSLAGEAHLQGQQRLFSTKLCALKECRGLCLSPAPVGWQCARHLPSGRLFSCCAAAPEALHADTAETSKLRSQENFVVENTGQQKSDGPSTTVTEQSGFCIVNFYHLTRVEQPFKVSSLNTMFFCLHSFLLCSVPG